MTLWALRRAVLGPGVWQIIRSESHLERLMNSPRKRQPQIPSTVLPQSSLF